MRVTSDSPSYLTGIKAFVLAYETVVVNPNIMKHADIGLISSISGLTSFTNNFAIDNSIFGSPVLDFNCIIGSGEPYLNISINQPGIIELLLVYNNSGITHFDNQNIQSAHITAICLVQCPRKTFIGTQPYACLSCGDYIRNCKECFSQYNCSACALGSYLGNNNHTCLLCT